MKIRKSGKQGFTLVEIMIVVSLVGLLATIATPTWVRARTTSQMQACINNLRQIDGAKQQWALENKIGPSATPGFGDIGPYLKSSIICPAAGTDNTFSGSYAMNPVSVKPTCRKVPDTHVLPDTSE